MGMFSWLTADTERSIAALGSSRPTFTVFLLGPDGSKYQEDHYEGYGVFGGMDAHDLCAKANADHLGMTNWYEQASPDERRIFGIFLDMGQVYRDTNGKLWVVCTTNYPCLERLFIRRAKGNYGEPADDDLPTPNQLISLGEWEKVSNEELGLMKYPIKIVESSCLSYEDVGPSSACPDQGVFYEDDSDDEWDEFDL